MTIHSIQRYPKSVEAQQESHENSPVPAGLWAARADGATKPPRSALDEYGGEMNRMNGHIAQLSCGSPIGSIGFDT